MTAYLATEFTVTLMRLVDDEFYVESGDRTFTYYFAVPDAWLEGGDDRLQEQVFEVAQRLYSDLNHQFRIAEPSDPNFLKVKATRATPLAAAELETRPWLAGRGVPVWEQTPCVSVGADGIYRRVLPADFGET